MRLESFAKGLYRPFKRRSQTRKENDVAEQQSARTRMNLSQTAKGLVQFDITAEYSTPEETVTQLGKALDLLKTLAQEKGLKLVEEAK
jgi:hypothetical protein